MIRIYGKATSMAFFKATLLFFAFTLGQALDDSFGTYPLFIFLLTVLAMVVGFWYIYRVAIKNDKKP